MNLKILFLKARLKLFPRLAGKYDFNEILKAAGIRVGKGTIFYDPNSMSIDRQRPWMLEIGEYCKITKGTVILAHDYSHSVLRRAYGELIGEAGHTIIGDNVFIGMNSIILMGSKIGNNVIIGAGSVVNGVIPDNCVAAGNPCRVIQTLDEHYHRRKEKSVNEAKLYVNTFIQAYGREPKVAEMGHFFPLFLERSRAALEQNGVNVSLNGDDPEDLVSKFLSSEPLFKSYGEFIQWCRLNSDSEVDNDCVKDYEGRNTEKGNK